MTDGSIGFNTGILTVYPGHVFSCSANFSRKTYQWTRVKEMFGNSVSLIPELIVSTEVSDISIGGFYFSVRDEIMYINKRFRFKIGLGIGAIAFGVAPDPDNIESTGGGGVIPFPSFILAIGYAIR